MVDDEHADVIDMHCKDKPLVSGNQLIVLLLYTLVH